MSLYIGIKDLFGYTQVKITGRLKFWAKYFILNKTT